MTAGPEPDLAELLADRAGTVVLTQAATPTEARLIRERITAAGGTLSRRSASGRRETRAPGSPGPSLTAGRTSG